MFHIRDNCFNLFDGVSCSGNFPIGIMDGLLLFFNFFFYVRNVLQGEREGERER